MEYKALQTVIKDLTDAGEGRAVIATLHVKDLDGDVTLSGFFGRQDLRMVPAHDWRHVTIGKGVLHEEGEQALVDFKMNLEIPAARDWYEAIKFDLAHPPALQEYSYGFTIRPGGARFGEWNGENVRFLQPAPDGGPGADVHEFSPVLLGAGLGTGTEAIKALKAAIPPHTTPTAPEDTAWDGPAMVRECPAEAAALRRMHAWVDSEADPDLKSSYKLPHHDLQGRVVWRAVAAGMTALLGGRGGVDIPSGDRRGVYNHFARHYAQFDKEVPDFRGIVFEDQAESAETSLADVAAFIARSRSLADLRAKDGRELSAANRARLSRLLEQLTGIAGDVEELLQSTEPPDKARARELMALWLQCEQTLAQIAGA